MPDDKDDGKSPEKKIKLMEIRVPPSKKSNDAAYQELVKTCKDSENEEDDPERKLSLDTTDEMTMNDTSVTNGEQYEEEQYAALPDSYFENESITLKVINDQIGKHFISNHSSIEKIKN